MRKLSDDECPLHLRLCAGPSEKALSLVLKENETGDVNVGFLLALKIVYDKVQGIICWTGCPAWFNMNCLSPQWDAFSFPELCNFLRILKREEEEHVRQIVKRYALARDMMKQAMARITSPAWLWFNWSQSVDCSDTLIISLISHIKGKKEMNCCLLSRNAALTVNVNWPVADLFVHVELLVSNECGNKQVTLDLIGRSSLENHAAWLDYL